MNVLTKSCDLAFELFSSFYLLVVLNKRKSFLQKFSKGTERCLENEFTRNV